MDDERDVRRAAASALQELHDPAAIDGMIAALNVHHDSETLRALGATGDPPRRRYVDRVL